MCNQFAEMTVISFFLKTGLRSVFTTSGMTIIIHAIGSQIMIPQYPMTGARRNATATFVSNSKALENTGVFVSPNPCMELRNRQMTVGTILHKNLL